MRNINIKYYFNKLDYKLFLLKKECKIKNKKFFKI